MSVIPIDVERTEGGAAWELHTFWQKIAQALDRLVVNRSCRMIPAMALRRAEHDRARCRRLMRGR